MCEFCVKHGDGKKWYLQAKNYSEDLLSDVARRRFIEDGVRGTEKVKKALEKIAWLDRAPGFIRRLIGGLLSRKLKKLHHGQVAPIDDVEAIFGFVNSVIRLPCYCRRITLGREERYCYGLSLGPNGGKLAEIIQVDGSFLNGPDSAGVEVVAKEDALSAMRSHEQSGLCHTLWTFHTPFIGGICNCDRADCLGMRVSLGHGVPALYPSEYVAQTNPDECAGCRECMRVCQFGAFAFSVATQKAAIDPKRCYGCGVCRSVCPSNAITLKERQGELIPG